MRKICENQFGSVVRFVVMRGATTQYFSLALHISAGIRWETTSWIPTSQKTAGIHDPGLRITPGSDPDPGMIPGLARALLGRCQSAYAAQHMPLGAWLGTCRSVYTAQHMPPGACRSAHAASAHAGQSHAGWHSRRDDRRHSRQHGQITCLLP